MKAQYQQHGYVIARNVLSHDEISAISKYASYIYQTWKRNNESDIVNYQLVNMHSLTDAAYFENSPEDRVKFFNAISPKCLTTFIENTFGESIYFHNSQLFFNPVSKEKRPYWHRDMQYSDLSDETQKKEQNSMLSLHLRIPLVKEVGVELIPGSHKRWDTVLEQNVRFEREGHKNTEQLPQSKLIKLDVGDVVVFSAQMLHRGNYALNSSRCALDLCIGSYHPLNAGFIDRSMQPTDTEMQQIKNNQWFIKAKEIMAYSKTNLWHKSLA